MLELDCTAITPEDVFKTSGHVDKFADWMCKDEVKGEYLRADHLVENVLQGRLKGDRMARGLVAQRSDASDHSNDAKKEKTKVKDVKVRRLDDSVVAEYEEILAKIDNFDGDALGHLITHLQIRNPDGNNPVLPPQPFNLMFKSSIGPSAAAPVYLRPETAQGQFLHFRKLLEYNNNAMPFASASIGKSYRNEISPRSGLLRVREFLMAEIEHFVDPAGGKRHDRFDEVRNLTLALLARDTQLAGQTTVQQRTIGDAVSQKIVDNETIGYFLARVQLFLLKIGIDKKKLRFRQHMANEMAHYAADCWDAELLTSYGWIECVGVADRSAYDLSVHAKRTGDKLFVQQQLPKPVQITQWEASLNKALLGPKYRKDAQIVEHAFASLNQDSLERLASDLNAHAEITIPCPPLSSNATQVTIPGALITISRQSRTSSVREYVPNVIEPSFGIGRILYSLLEHVYYHRPSDSARGVLSLPITMAPTKVLLVPLSTHSAFSSIIKRLSQGLRTMSIAARVDNSSASISKRYARNDELGTPLGIRVDFDTIALGSITLRERDSTKQVRASMDDILAAVKNLVDATETWADVQCRLPEFTGQEAEGTSNETRAA